MLFFFLLLVFAGSAAVFFLYHGFWSNVLNVIKRHGLNVEEIANTVFDGASATCTKLMLSGRPSERCRMEIRAFHEVLHVDAIALPNMA